jgi:hypothetical protein
MPPGLLVYAGIRSSCEKPFQDMFGSDRLRARSERDGDLSLAVWPRGGRTGRFSRWALSSKSSKAGRAPRLSSPSRNAVVASVGGGAGAGRCWCWGGGGGVWRM